MKFFVAIISIIFCIQLPAWGQEGYSRVRIHPPKDRNERARLLGDLEIDHFTTDQQGGIIAEISHDHLLKLKNSQVMYSIITKDIKQELDSLNAIYYKKVAARVPIEQPGGVIDNIIRTPSAFEVKATFGGYYSFTEMEAAMNTLVATYPSIASKTSIGKTANNRDIWVIKISDAVNVDETGEPEVLYMGLQHAREAITGSSMIFFMQYLCENYSTDSRIQNLVNNREIFIIPCFNPDGWEYNRTTTGAGGGWRKNRSKVDSSKQGQNWNYTYGVDLNRNWGVDWANCSAPILGNASSCGSSSPSGETYWGNAAFSEKETQAVKAFVESHHIVAGFDQHAYGPYYSIPFGRHSLHTLSAKGDKFFTAIPAIMGKYNGMRAADSYDALGYEVAGGFKDWMMLGNIGTGTKDTVWAMTGEGGAGGGTGGSYGSFWAPASQIVNLCKGMCYQNLQLALSAGTYTEIQDRNSMALYSASGQLSFSLRRLGLANDPVTVTLVPLENMQNAGAPVVINSMSNYYDTVIRQISYTLSSGLSNGARIRYIWRVESGGYSFSDTIVKLYNPIMLVSDDMEGNFNTNWSASSNVADNWAYTNLAAYGGSQSLTESPAGNYTSSTTRTVVYKNAIDLSDNTAAYLCFRIKHRAENFRDKLQVQVSTNSTNGTDGTWTAIAGSSTVQEPSTLDGSTINGQPALTGIRDDWNLEVFDLSAAGFKSSNFRFRFVFTSDADPSSFKFERDDGFYIDDLQMVKSTAPVVALPVHFLKFTGKLLPEQKVELKWEAVTDAQHDHFIVERSVDGLHFTAIGVGPHLAPYHFTDEHPVTGNNFYRIRQVDKNGSYTFSSIINVHLVMKKMISVVPNPVRDKMHLRSVNLPPSGPIMLQIYDMQGRKVHSSVIVNTGNGFSLDLDTTRWLPQTYSLIITTKEGQLLCSETIMKL